VLNVVSQKKVQGESDEVMPLADRLAEIHDQLYSMHGHGAITKAADELGVRRERVSNVLNQSARDIITDLEEMIAEDESE